VRGGSNTPHVAPRELQPSHMQPNRCHAGTASSAFTHSKIFHSRCTFSFQPKDLVPATGSSCVMLTGSQKQIHHDHSAALFLHCSTAASRPLLYFPPWCISAEQACHRHCRFCTTGLATIISLHHSHHSGLQYMLQAHSPD